MAGDGGGSGTLASEPWTDLERAWRRRDSVPFRNVMAHILRGVGDDELDLWRDLGDAIMESRWSDPLRELAHDEGIDPEGLVVDEETWTALAGAVTGSLEDAVGRLPASSRRAALALLATFLYFEALCFWELGGVYAGILGVTASVEGLHDRVEANRTVFGRSQRIVAVARGLAHSVRAQFEADGALGCSCPFTFDRAATRVSGLLGEVVDSLHAAGPDGPVPADHDGHDPDDRLPGGSDRALRALGDLLEADALHTCAYYTLLQQHVGPAARAFVDNLGERRDDETVVELLRDAIDAAAAFETSAVGRRLAIFATEARAQRATLTAMHDRLTAGHPSLRVTEGKIVLVYPFSLPVESGDAFVRSLVASAPRRVGLVVAGAPVQVDHASRSFIWIRGGTDETLDTGLKLVFGEHELTLETTAGLRYHDLDVEIRLNGLGNHFVRIGVSVDTRVTHASEPVAARWTPHELDQWARRVDSDFGAERIWFEPRGAMFGGPPEPPEPAGGYDASPPRVYDLFTDLVADMVDDLVRLARESHADVADEEADDHEDGEDDEDEVRHLLLSTRVHAQVLAVVTGLERVDPGGSATRVTDPELLPELVGASTLLSGQRRYPTGLEEWVRVKVPPLDNLLGDDDLEGELVVRNENLTLVFTAVAPNWQLIPYEEMVEFAASLAGSYTLWARWLSAAAHQHGRGLPAAPTKEQLDELLARSVRLVAHQSDVRTFLDHVRSRELLSNRRNGRLLDRLMLSGRIGELEGELDAALETVRSHQEHVAALVSSALEHRARSEADARQGREAAQQRREFIFNGGIGVVAVLGLFELFSWLNGERDWTGRPGVFWVEALLAVGAAIVAIGVLVDMHRKSSQDDAVEPDGSAASSPRRRRWPWSKRVSG